jgi:RNA polymerase sigma factor (sigma-70 family)
MREAIPSMNPGDIPEILAGLHEAADRLGLGLDREGASAQLSALRAAVLGIEEPFLSLDATEDGNELLIDEDQASELLGSNQWMLPIQSYKVLTTQEHIECANKIEAGVLARGVLEGIFPFDGTYSSSQLEELVRQGEAAQDRMICGNLRLVLHLAHIYRRKGYEDLEDSFQDGVFGLVRAIEGWDTSMGYAFSTYATWHIRQRINRGRQDRKYFMRIPVHIQAAWEQSAPPEWSKLAIYAFEAIQNVVSWEWLEDHDEDLDHEKIGKPFDSEEIFETQQDFDLAFQAFQDPDKSLLREADILERRFGLRGGDPETLDAIGGRYGVTRERVRQIELVGMDIMRLSLIHANPLLRDAVAHFVLQSYPKYHRMVELVLASGIERPSRLAKYLKVSKNETRAVLSVISAAFASLGNSYPALLVN